MMAVKARVRKIKIALPQERHRPNLSGTGVSVTALCSGLTAPILLVSRLGETQVL